MDALYPLAAELHDVVGDSLDDLQFAADVDLIAAKLGVVSAGI